MATEPSDDATRDVLAAFRDDLLAAFESHPELRSVPDLEELKTMIDAPLSPEQRDLCLDRLKGTLERIDRQQKRATE